MDNNFADAFPSNYMNKFIDHPSMILKKKENTHLSYQKLIPLWEKKLTGGVYSILSQKQTFFWILLDPTDSFGLDGLKNCIIQDNKSIIEKIFLELTRWKGLTIKKTLVNIRFNLNACKNLSKKELDVLSDTAKRYFCSK